MYVHDAGVDADDDAVAEAAAADDDDHDDEDEEDDDDEEDYFDAGDDDGDGNGNGDGTGRGDGDDGGDDDCMYSNAFVYLWLCMHTCRLLYTVCFHFLLSVWMHCHKVFRFCMLFARDALY